MYCNNCGNYIIDGNFCSFCGNKLVDNNQMVNTNQQPIEDEEAKEKYKVTTSTLNLHNDYSKKASAYSNFSFILSEYTNISSKAMSLIFNYIYTYNSNNYMPMSIFYVDGDTDITFTINMNNKEVNLDLRSISDSRGQQSFSHSIKFIRDINQGQMYYQMEMDVLNELFGMNMNYLSRYDYQDGTEYRLNPPTY